MCAGPDPNARLKAQAEQRHKEKLYAFQGRNLAYKNKSAIVAAKQKDLTGLIKSRNTSDLMVGLEQQRGRHYKKVEVASKGLFREMVTGVAKGGGSVSRQAMFRGGTKAQKYLDQIAKSEAGLELAKGRGQAILLEEQRRQTMAANAGLRQKQGLPPNFGMSTSYVPVHDNRALSTIATGLSIGSMFAGAGALPLGFLGKMFGGG